MNRYSSFLLLTALFFRVDLAHSVFGAEDVPLEDYYEFGKHQTGVASVRVTIGSRTGLGTANLIDVKDIGIPLLKDRLGSLRGRVLITAAHVICDGDPGSSSVRFMNEKNESQTVGVLKSVLSGQKIKYVCLGTVLNIPLGNLNSITLNNIGKIYKC